MNIRMAIVLNNLHTSNGRVCPMPHCRSSSFANATGGGNTCSDCGVWFAEACKLEKRPYLEEFVDSSEEERAAKRVRRQMRTASSYSDEEKTRLELAAIKNIRIQGGNNHITRFPFENQAEVSKIHSRLDDLRTETYLRTRNKKKKLVSEREAELLKRLRRLEGVVEELSFSSDHSSSQKDKDHSSDTDPDKQQPQDQRKEGPQPPLVPTNRGFESKMVHAPDWDGNQYTGTAKDQSIPVDVELDYIPSNISSFGGGAENDFLLVETNGESVQSGVAFGNVDLDSHFSKDAINRMFMKYERIIPRQRGVGRYHAPSTQIPAGGTDLKFHEILEEAILEARKLENHPNHPNLSDRFRTSSSLSSYNSTSSPSTSSIPMSIPHSQDPVPPPLPPPRYLTDIIDNKNNGRDITWQ
ncbi:hypothetical protein V8E51_007586 [Hyaloscypha variabilis]